MSKSDHKSEPSPSPAPVTVTVGAGDGALDARSDALQRVAFAMDRLLTDLSLIKRGDNATIDGRFGYRSRAPKDLNRDRKLLDESAGRVQQDRRGPAQEPRRSEGRSREATGLSASTASHRPLAKQRLN